MRQTPLEKRITDMIESVVKEQGLALVCLSLRKDLLEVMVEDPETRNLDLDAAADLSREISALLDVEDPISGAYRLEVGSPGIDRPLTRPEDFSAFTGHEAKVEVDPPQEGQKRFRGMVKGFEEGNVLLDVEGQGVMALPYEDIVKAKLVMSEKLLKGI